MRQTGMTWVTALAETRCYDFLEPVAARAVDRALELCPDAATLVGDDARKDMLALCLSRLGVVYERPLTLRADRKSTRLNSSHPTTSRMPSSA